jgi:hypothetical protein
MHSFAELIVDHRRQGSRGLVVDWEPLAALGLV